MSSVAWKKCTATSGAAMIGHFTRYDGREEVEYRNKYIKPELSHENYMIGAGRFDSMPTASSIVNQLKKRVCQIDQDIPPRRKVKDRITIMTYSIAAPEGLTDEQERDFFEIAHEELARISGGRENISVGFVHKDEIHDYIGTNGQRSTSRSHMHVAGVPYTTKKGINGKAFETRARMRELNQRIDERCQQELGFKFMTGEKGLTGRSVEELQASSETLALKTQIEELTKLRDSLKAEIYELHQGNQLDQLLRHVKMRQELEAYKKLELQHPETFKSLRNDSERSAKKMIR